MHKLRRALFSQNFLHNRGLVERLVRSSSLGKNDLVLEIGPGKGIITEFLLRQVQHVLAVEIDSKYTQYLQARFTAAANLTIYSTDFLTYQLPKLPYKVFANVPFAIEGQIIRKLIDGENPPEDCYLVVMKELATRLSAPKKENQFSLIHKPWFDMQITHRFNRKDFTPYSVVDSVLFQITKRGQPLLPISEKRKYEQLIQRGFGNGLPIYQNLVKFYGKDKISGTLFSLNIGRETLPNRLGLHEWIILYSKLTR